MKKLIFALALTTLLLGCHCTQPGSPGTQTTNAVPRDANSIQIVFTNAPPTNVVALLNGIGAKPDAAGLIWQVQYWNFRDQQQEAALEASLRAGATFKGGR
jgi:hypothetical protein